MTIYMAKVMKDGIEINVLAGKPMSDRKSLEEKLFKQGFRVVDSDMDKWEGKGKVAQVYRINF